MKKRIKKTVKFLCFFIVGILLLTAGLWFALSEYYLPSYVEKNILPKLAKECGYRGFSGKVQSIGLFGANLGKISLKSQNKIIFEAKNVKISYSPRQLYYLKRFVIKSLDFDGVKLRYSLHKDKMLINNIEVKKFLELIKGNFFKKTRKKIPVTVQLINITEAKVAVAWKKYQRSFPCRAVLIPSDKLWNKFKIKLSLFDASREIKLLPVINLTRTSVDVKSPLKCKNKMLFELAWDFGLLPKDYNSRCQGSFSGKLSFNARLTPLKLRDLKLEGVLNNTWVSDKMFQLRPARRKSGRFIPVNMLLQWQKNQVRLQLSSFELQKPFSGRIENFSCFFANKKNPHYLLRGIGHINLGKLNFAKKVKLQMLNDFTLKRKFELKFFKNTQQWDFSSPRSLIIDKAQKEIFARMHEGALMGFRGGELAVSGRGKGYSGDLDITFSCPEVSYSLQKNDMSSWFLENLRASSRLSFAGTKSVLDTYINFDKFTLKHKSNCLRLKAHSSLKSTISYNNIFSLNPVPGNLRFNFNCQELDGYCEQFNSRVQNLTLSASLPVLDNIENINVAVKLDNATTKFKSGGLCELSGLRLSGDEKSIESTVSLLRLEAGEQQFNAQSLDLKLQNISRGKTAFLPESSKIICSVSKGFNYKHDAGTKLSGDRASTVCSLRLMTQKHLLPAIKSLSTTVKLKNISGRGKENSFSSELLSTSANLIFSKASVPEEGWVRVFSPSWQGKTKELAFKGGGLRLRSELSARNQTSTHATLRKISCSGKNTAFSLTVSELDIKSQSKDVFKPGANHTGSLNITDGTFSIPNKAIALKGVNAKLPFNYQYPKDNYLFSLTGGLCKVNSLEIKTFGCGGGEIELKKLSEREFSLRADFVNKLIPAAKTFGFGKIKLDDYGKLSLEGDLLMPKYTSKKELHMGRFFPELDGFSFAGTIAAKGNFLYQNGRFEHSLKLDLANAMLKSNIFNINGLNFNCLFTDIFAFKSAPRQGLTYDSLLLDGIKLRSGSLDVELQSPEKIYISSHKFELAGGELRARDMYIKSGRRSYAMNILARNLSLAETLKFFGVASDVSSNGRLDGIIPIEYRDNRIVFKNAKLFSIPDSGSMKLKIKQFSPMAEKRSKPAATSLFYAAMKDFAYSSLRLDFSGSFRDNLSMRLITDGSPAAPLPFCYDKKTDSFARVPDNAANKLSGTMHLDSNFNLGSNAANK